MTSPRNSYSLLSIGVLLVATVLVAGCGDKKFDEAAPRWTAGHRWEYSVESVDTEETKGTLPGGVPVEDGDRRVNYHNETQRIEIINTTTVTTDGVALHVGARLTTPESLPGPADQPVRTPVGYWEAAFFTQENLNVVHPDSFDFGSGVVTLRGEGGGSGSEDLKFQFPLKNGKTWSESSDNDELARLGSVEHRVVKMESRQVPAGSFDAVRLVSRFVPNDPQALENAIRGFFASDGAQLDELQISFEDRTTTWYAPSAAYIVEEEHVESFFLHAKGRDNEGNAFDFSESGRDTTTSKLLKYERSERPERPLSFVNAILGGGYTPTPITPLSDNAAEVVVSSDGLNAAAESDPTVEFRLRIFNSSKGEERLRDEDLPYPAVAPGSAYDPEVLVANWSFSRRAPNGTESIPGTFSGNRVSLSASQLGGMGLKQATVRLMDKKNNVEVSSDEVLFEVYWSTNVTVRATENNATRRYVHVDFPMTYGASRLDVRMQFSDQAPHQFGRVVVNDATGNGVRNEANGVRFTNTRLGEHSPGLWQVRFIEGLGVPVIGSDYTFQIESHYRDVATAEGESARTEARWL